MRSLNTETARIGVVLLVMLSLAIWRFEFVSNAVAANPALNLIIFGTFLFGLTLVGVAIYGLRNEFRSLYALMERYDDVVREASAENVDPLWRYYRCAKMGIIIQRPKILGQSYQLISGQLNSHNSLRVSTSTMQTLMEGIDDRLSESRALIGYIAGTLIFLGLIGTFIGLMVTLASVGSILGELDLSGSDPTDTISALMQNLQIPLGGMATGFSSSLFGLLTSLTISIMIQLLNRAGGALKNSFSEWLTKVVAINDHVDGVGGSTATPEQRSTAMEERRLALLMRTARYTVQSNQRHSRMLTEMRDSLQTLAKRSASHDEHIDRLTSATSVLARQHELVNNALARTADVLDDVSGATQMRDEVTKLTKLVLRDQHTRDKRVLSQIEQIRDEIVLVSSKSEEKKADCDTEADALASALASHSDQLNVDQLNKLLGAIYSAGGDDTNPDEVVELPDTTATKTASGGGAS